MAPLGKGGRILHRKARDGCTRTCLPASEIWKPWLLWYKSQLQLSMSLWFSLVWCSALRENVINPKGTSAYIYETTQYGSVLSKGIREKMSANGCEFPSEKPGPRFENWNVWICKPVVVLFTPVYTRSLQKRGKKDKGRPLSKEAQRLCLDGSLDTLPSNQAIQYNRRAWGLGLLELKISVSRQFKRFHYTTVIALYLDEIGSK